MNYEAYFVQLGLSLVGSGDIVTHSLRLVSSFMSRKLTLPDDWEQSESDGTWYYFNTGTRQVSWSHPLDVLVKAFIFVVKDQAIDGSVLADQVYFVFAQSVDTLDDQWIFNNLSTMIDLHEAYFQSHGTDSHHRGEQNCCMDHIRSIHALSQEGKQPTNVTV